MIRRGFNLKINLRSSLLNRDTYNHGKRLQEDFESELRNSIESFLDEDGIVDSTKVLEDWFPSVDADIFISHSHNDEQFALALAGYIKEKVGLSCFVDSTVWKSCDSFMEMMIEDNSSIYSSLYGLETSEQMIKRLSPKVYMTLILALQQMIYKTKTVIFVNTHNSILSDTVASSFTTSPWISYELSLANILIAEQNISEPANFSESRKIKYVANLERFKTIDENSLKEWAGSASNGSSEEKLKELEKLAINNVRSVLH